MRNYSLSVDILADALEDFIYSGAEIYDVINFIRREFPSITDEDAVKVFQFAQAFSARKSNDSVEIVATTPISFKTKIRKTRPVIEDLINEAEKSIQLTGYSISEHFEDLLKLINGKSKQGIMVELFVNRYDKVRIVLMDIEHVNRRFFKVYMYSGKSEDKMAALHAKTILIDGRKMLISSANLSYDGLDKNIEIGALITSQKKLHRYKKFFRIKTAKDIHSRGIEAETHFTTQHIRSKTLSHSQIKNPSFIFPKSAQSNSPDQMPTVYPLYKAQPPCHAPS